MDAITARDVIGWTVPILGIAIATVVAALGWKRTAETAIRAQERRRELEDDLAREVLLDAVSDGLGVAIVTLPLMIDRITQGLFVSPELVSLMDEGRRQFDRNKDSIVLWRNNKEKGRIKVWFREMAVWRARIEMYVLPGPGTEPTRVYAELVPQHLELFNSALAEARGLYEELDLPRLYPGQIGYDKWAAPSRK